MFYPAKETVAVDFVGFAGAESLVLKQVRSVV